MLLQSSHSQGDRGLDPYWTPPEAIQSLLVLEKGNIPKFIWEPACGAGAIAEPLKKAGYYVLCSDIKDYGYPCFVKDYFHWAIHELNSKPKGIITNPPFKLAELFVSKALKDTRYSAFLLQTNFLESLARKPLFDRNPPNRVWISSRRLPMMHRLGWTGPQAPSNTCYAWFIWDRDSVDHAKLSWFDWKEFSF